MGSFAKLTAETFEADPVREPETLQLVQAFFAIEDVTVRRRLLDLTKALAAESEETVERRVAATGRRR
jgi:hypothetical protein